MKVVGFIGAYDKTDMLLNLAKILTVMENRVLIVDSTINQKAKYVVPAINPTVSYITFFEDIDVAIGFNNLDEIKKYIGEGNKDLPYDIILVDADTETRLEEFNLKDSYKNYFVTSFDLYSLRRGMEILKDVKEPISLTKILFSKEMLKEEDDYLNYLSMGYKVTWEQEIIYLPIENGDLSVISENQRLQRIKFKRLSIEYKDSVCFIAQQILNQKNDSNVRKAMKILEKEQ